MKALLLGLTLLASMSSFAQEIRIAKINGDMLVSNCIPKARGFLALSTIFHDKFHGCYHKDDVRQNFLLEGSQVEVLETTIEEIATREFEIAKIKYVIPEGPRKGEDAVGYLRVLHLDF